MFKLTILLPTGSFTNADSVLMLVVNINGESHATFLYQIRAITCCWFKPAR